MAHFRELLTGYRIRMFSWHVLDQVLVTGVPKLVLFPILAALLGPTEFGLFVLALSAAQSIGLSPSNGLQGWVLRNLENYPQDVWDGLTARAALWGFLATIPFALVTMLAPMWAHAIFESPEVGVVLMGMGPYLLATNFLETLLARQRVRRNLHTLVLWHGLHLLAVVAGAIVVWDGSASRGMWGISLGSSLAAMLMLLSSSRNVWTLPRPLVRQARAEAFRIWWPMSLSALLALTAHSVDRVLVGVWLSAELVATYFAAASLASLVLVPFGLLAGWLYTMLGRAGAHAERVRHHWRLALPALLAGIVLLAVIIILAGPWILPVFYPNFAPAAKPIWWILVLASAATGTFIIIRPFVVKFSDPKTLPALTLLSLGMKVGGLALLIPRFGLIGAAAATLVAAIVISVAWWLVLNCTSMRSGSI